MATPTGYSRTQIGLHWIIAALIALQYIFHEAISDKWEAFTKGIDTATNPLVPMHVFGGLLIGAFVLWRLVVRLRRGAPPPPEHEPAPLKLAARVAHWAFYGLMIMLPLSGAVAWFGGIEQAADNHELFKTALMALIVLHIAATLFHQFYLRSGVLDRMRKPQG